jgi:hypothetical protein
MKKNYFLALIAAICLVGITSCNEDDNGNGEIELTASPIKSIAFSAWGDTESWEFSYNTSGKLTQFVNYWNNELDKTITYDYSTSGKLILNKDGSLYNTYDINAQGYITKDPDGNTYEYDANGYLVKMYEFWDNANHLKYEITITNKNITKITTYDDDGVTVKKIKEFSYTSGDNVNNIHQANVIDSEWKQMGNFYGKPSAKLVNYFEYWDPRTTPVEKSRSSITYTFDDKNRPITVVKTLTDQSTETWTYTYYEDEK